MPHSEPERASASALLLTWLITPLIAIGIGLFAGALAFVGSLAALCASISRRLSPLRSRVSRALAPGAFMPILPEPRHAPTRRRRFPIDSAPR
jgi:hypothetical protein